MSLGSAADDGPVSDLGLAGNADIADEDAVVSYGTIVGDMHVRHYQCVASDLGDALAAGLGAPVDGDTFTDGDIVSYLHIGYLSVKLEVLRNGSKNGSREDFAVLSHLHVRINHSVRMYLAAVSDFYIFVNECVWPDLDVVSENRLRADGSKWMDLVHVDIVLFCCADGLPDGLGDVGIDSVSRLVACDVSLEISPGEPEIPDHVEKFVPSAFIRETEFKIIEITALVHPELRHVEQGGHPLELLVADRMLHDDDGIVHIAALDEVVGE